MDQRKRSRNRFQMGKQIMTTEPLTADGLTRAQVQDRIENVWSRAEYIAWLNGDEDGGLVADPAHWDDMGCTTALDVANHLDGAHARNIEKSERY